MDSEVSKQRRLNVVYRSVNPATGEVLKRSLNIPMKR